MLNSFRLLLPLASSVLLGQVAMIGFGVADTVLLGRLAGSDQVAVLALGQAVYVTVWVTASGVLQALLPVLGHAWGANDRQELSTQFEQGLWLALLLTVVAAAVLLWPQPLLLLAGGGADAQGAVTYLRWLMLGLPALLLFRVHASLCQALSRPLLVTLLQLGGLLFKVIASYALLRHWLPVTLPLQPAAACALATATTEWLMLGLGLLQLRWSPALRAIGLLRAKVWPDGSRLWLLLRLGAPIGVSQLVEVSAFTAMALFIARFGTVQLAAHQIAANLAALFYMLPLSIGIAGSALVAQHIGAAAPRQAAHAAWSGVALAVALSAVIALLLVLERDQVVALYSSDPQVRAVCSRLLLFIAAYQVFDACQCSANFMLRAWHVTLLPSVLYMLSMWAVGLGGGWALAFDAGGMSTPSLQQAAGFWMGNSSGIVLIAIAFTLLLQRVTRRGG